MKRVFLLLAAGAVVVAPACSQSLDVAKVEEEVTTGIEEQTGASVSSLDCPEEVAIEEGDTFTCSVETDQGPGTVNVTQTDDEGTVEWELVPE